MRLIDADTFIKESCGGCTMDCRCCDDAWMIEKIKQAPTVDAVPITELLELRNSLYETDSITMKGLKILNELIAMHDGERKDNG